MTSQTRDRNRLGAFVSRLASVDSSFADTLSAVDAQGRKTIVPVMIDDSLMLVGEMVARLGGDAAVVIGEIASDKTVSIRILRMIQHVGTNDDGDHHVPVPPSCTVRDLLAFLLPGSSITIRIDDAEVEFGDLTEQHLSPELVS